MVLTSPLRVSGENMMVLRQPDKCNTLSSWPPFYLIPPEEIKVIVVKIDPYFKCQCKLIYTLLK